MSDATIFLINCFLYNDWSRQPTASTPDNVPATIDRMVLTSTLYGAFTRDDDQIVGTVAGNHSSYAGNIVVTAWDESHFAFVIKRASGDVVKDFIRFDFPDRDEDDDIWLGAYYNGDNRFGTATCSVVETSSRILIDPANVVMKSGR